MDPKEFPPELREQFERAYGARKSTIDRAKEAIDELNDSAENLAPLIESVIALLSKVDRLQLKAVLGAVAAGMRHIREVSAELEEINTAMWHDQLLRNATAIKLLMQKSGLSEEAACAVVMEIASPLDQLDIKSMVRR